MKAGNMERLWSSAEEKLKRKKLILVCNAKKSPNASVLLGSFNMDTEYFSDDEFEEVVSMFQTVGLHTDYFTYEDDFFHYVIECAPSNLVVYNAAQSGVGPGRKSLVPAFCNLHAIPCTGSNAYVVSLCRHKYHVNKILSQAGISTPKSWLYQHDWLMDLHPPKDTKLLLKPIYESASIGIEDSSIRFYTKELDLLVKQLTEQHHQPIIAQEFIPGYEVEVPLLCVNNDIYQLPPVGITINGKHDLGDDILNYDRIYFDKYGFYDFSLEHKNMAEKLCSCAADVARLLGMEGLCRVDYRIKNDGTFYVTDVSTNPHFVSHSSVHFSFNALGLSSEHIAKTILSAAVEKR